MQDVSSDIFSRGLCLPSDIKMTEQDRIIEIIKKLFCVRRRRYNMTENKRMIPFSPPDVSELEVAEVAEALRSGWITTGPRTKQLEKNIAQWIGTEKCVCLNS